MPIVKEARASYCDQLAAKISNYLNAGETGQLRQILTSAGYKRFRSQQQAEYVAFRCLIALGLTEQKIDAAFVVINAHGAWYFRIGFRESPSGKWQWI